MKVKISVIINTYNRSLSLIKTVESILKCNFTNFEIIVVEQQGIGNLKNELRKLHLPSKNVQIRYFNLKNKGVSRAKNFGIWKSKGELISFTDDDCIVSRSWLREIYTAFKENEKICGVFGRTLPFKPSLNKSLICPSTFTKIKSLIISSFSVHTKNIGFGNNMSFRKKIFTQHGGFKEWLGAGSIGSNAEDAEFALRLLTKQELLLYSSRVLLYHNRWLTKKNFMSLQLSYSRGEFACYGYFAFIGEKIAKKLLIRSLQNSIHEISQAIRYRKISESYWSIKNLISKIFGGLIAGFFVFENKLK